MARAASYYPFKVCYRTQVSTVIRDHHVYMSIWTPTVGENLFTVPDAREEAVEYDKFSIGVYKDIEKKFLVYYHKYQAFVIIFWDKVMTTR